jgi:ABC-type arginine transport system ATPase subunit
MKELAIDSVNLSTSEVPELILIGPTGAGKSTLGALLGKQLNLPSVSIDDIAQTYYEECNFGRAVFKRLQAEQGFLATYRQWCPALAHATERVIEEHGRVVLDLGAGHSHYEDPILFDRVRRAIAPCANIVLLLPSADLDKSVCLLRERCMSERGRDWIHDGYDFIEHWVKDYCNRDLATLTVFTEGKTPMETCEEIIERMRASSVIQEP